MGDLYIAPKGLALWCCHQKAIMPQLKVYRVVSAVSGLNKLNVMAFSEQEAIKQYSNIAGVEAWQVVVWYSYPLRYGEGL